MKNTSKPAWSQVICVVVFALVGLAALCTNAEAQTGNNAVYNSSGNCSACASSPTFIDATVFVTSPPPISQTFWRVAQTLPDEK